MADNAEVIRRLYDALDRHDGESMAALYAPDARFKDPAFGELGGEEAGDMWRMLTSRAEDLDVELADHAADDDIGTAHWIATYTFRTGRHVVNDIQARFRFRDGLIVEHEDSFSFHRWARQALGPAGAVLGLPPFNLLVRRQGARGSRRFQGGPAGALGGHPRPARVPALGDGAARARRDLPQGGQRAGRRPHPRHGQFLPALGAGRAAPRRRAHGDRP